MKILNWRLMVHVSNWFTIFVRRSDSLLLACQKSYYVYKIIHYCCCMVSDNPFDCYFTQGVLTVFMTLCHIFRGNTTVSLNIIIIAVNCFLYVHIIDQMHLQVIGCVCFCQCTVAVGASNSALCSVEHFTFSVSE